MQRLVNQTWQYSAPYCINAVRGTNLSEPTLHILASMDSKSKVKFVSVPKLEGSCSSAGRHGRSHARHFGRAPEGPYPVTRVTGTRPEGLYPVQQFPAEPKAPL